MAGWLGLRGDFFFLGCRKWLCHLTVSARLSLKIRWRDWISSYYKVLFSAEQSSKKIALPAFVLESLLLRRVGVGLLRLNNNGIYLIFRFCGFTDFYFSTQYTH
jgi:hypothetical protein